MPALINITIPAGTLLGWSQTPADAGTWGLMDADTARDLIEAASRHPRTRWCYTLTGPGGEAIAHACARGSHPWPPPRPAATGPPRRPRAGAARRAPGRAERHPRADRQGNLRPPPPRGPLHPQQEAEAPDPRPHGPLLRARLRRPGHHLRDRPHRPVPRRGNLRAQPQPALQPAPPRQARARLEARADRAGRHELDHALGPHLHHPPHPVRRITRPAPGLCGPQPRAAGAAWRMSRATGTPARLTCLAAGRAGRRASGRRPWAAC